MVVEYASSGARADGRSGKDGSVRVVGDRRRGKVLRLGAGEGLFRPGEAKDDLIYRIRKGRLEVSSVIPETETGGGPTRIYRAGEFAGLGFLEMHAAYGQALEPSEIVIWARRDFEKIAKQNTAYRAQQDEAVRLEFLWRRALVVAGGGEAD